MNPLTPGVLDTLGRLPRWQLDLVTAGLIVGYAGVVLGAIASLWWLSGRAEAAGHAVAVRVRRRRERADVRYRNEVRRRALAESPELERIP